MCEVQHTLGIVCHVRATSLVSIIINRVYMKFMSWKNFVFWDITPCSEAICSTETSGRHRIISYEIDIFIITALRI
jgi:hypothetical protein